MPESPPPKTRGFLFADLRGYSAFTEDRGDTAARDLIRRYRDLVRAEIARFRGSEIRTEGDSFYVVFDSVSQAVAAAMAIRDAAGQASREPDAPPIRVGIGIHAGEAEDGDQGIVSSAVNIAARVCSVADAGEVLVTDTVRSLVRTAIDVRFAPRGRRRFKGIAEPTAVFAVNTTGVRRRTRPKIPAIAAGATVLALGVALALLNRGGTSGLADPSNPPSPEAAAGSEPPVGLATPDDEPTFPNDAETELLDRLPNSIARTCEAADPNDAPVYELPTSNAGRAGQFIDIPLTLVAGVTCLTDLTRTTYWSTLSAANVDATFTRQLARLEVPQGDCSSSLRAWETWTAGAHNGKALCYVSSGGFAVLEWTYGDVPIYAVALRRDGDTGALYRWWRDVGRLVGR